MKITKTASGKRTIKISKKEWQSIGKTAGWIKVANEPTIEKESNPFWCTEDELKRSLLGLGISDISSAGGIRQTELGGWRFVDSVLGDRVYEKILRLKLSRFKIPLYIMQKLDLRQDVESFQTAFDVEGGIQEEVPAYGAALARSGFCRSKEMIEEFDKAMTWLNHGMARGSPVTYNLRERTNIEKALGSYFTDDALDRFNRGEISRDELAELLSDQTSAMATKDKIYPVS